MTPGRRAQVVGVGLCLLAAACAYYRLTARACLYSDQEPSQGTAPAAYVVLTSRPAPAQEKRSVAVCESYQRNLEPLAAFRDAATSEVVVTYWLLGMKKGTPCPRNCENLVGRYDYVRASRIAARVERPGVSGPLLVAFAPPPTAGGSGDSLVLDLSDFSDEDLDRAFGIWKDRISRDPSVWKSGFQIVLIREACRNFVEKYGKDILIVVKAS